MFFTVGQEGTVCVCLEESFGAVYPKDNEVHCCTCSYKTTSCSHVQAVLEATQSTECPVMLEPLQTCNLQFSGMSYNFATQPKLQSNKKISFFVPDHVQCALNQSYKECFQIMEHNLKNIFPTFIRSIQYRSIQYTIV